MVIKHRLLIGFTILIGFISSCVGVHELPLSFLNTPEKKIVNEYLKKGRAYEDKGDLVNAFKQYNLATTVNPSKQKAVESRDRVEEELKRLAAGHYQKGLRLL